MRGGAFGHHIVIGYSFGHLLMENLFLLQVISEIIETCRAHDFTDVVLVHEHRGVPDGLIISHLPFGPTAYFQLLNVVCTSIVVSLLAIYLLGIGFAYGRQNREIKAAQEVLNF